MSRLNHWTALRQRKISRRTMLGASAKAGVGAAGLALVGCGDDDDDAAPAVVDSSATDAAAGDAAAGDAAAGDAADATGRAAEAAQAAADAAAAAAAAGEAPWLRLRTRDFSPSPSPDPAQYSALAESIGAEAVETGGAPRFLDFLTDELQPWVRDRYAVSDDAVYVGNSMGGLFGVYTLFHRPAAFRRYVIGSPWLCWDPETATAYEPAYAADHTDLNATVFMAAGADEDVLPPAQPPAGQSLFRAADTAAHTRRLAEALEQRRYPSLDLTWRIFPEVTHFTMSGILVAHGLRAVYADWRRR